jgi:hypothetical protein
MASGKRVVSTTCILIKIFSSEMNVVCTVGNAVLAGFTKTVTQTIALVVSKSCIMILGLMLAIWPIGAKFGLEMENGT